MPKLRTANLLGALVGEIASGRTDDAPIGSGPPSPNLSRFGGLACLILKDVDR